MRTLVRMADVKSSKSPSRSGRKADTLTLEAAAPRVRFRITDPPKWYAGKKKAVTIRHVSEHRVVAVLEIISPGNKDSRSGLAAFVRPAFRDRYVPTLRVTTVGFRPARTFR